MNEMIRLRKFLIELNCYFDSYSYYDEETDETIIVGDEQQCYNVLMQNEEFHLLGSAVVKTWIHIAFTEWDSFMKACHTLNAFA